MRDYTSVMADRYFRGNGRWAKVVRINKNGRPWYSVAFGNRGECLAHTVREEPIRKDCDHLAEEWIIRNVLPRMPQVQESRQLKSA